MAAAKSVKVEYDSQSDSRDRSDRTRARGRAAKDVRDDDSTPRQRPQRLRDNVSDMAFQSAMDVRRLGFAWAQANTRFWMNSADVLGRLMLNFNERVFGMMGGTTCPNAAARDESDDDIDDGEVDSDLDEDRPGRARVSRASSMMVDDLTTAIREGSDVLVQAAEEFDRAFRGTASDRRERQASEDARRARMRRRQAERQREDAEDDVRTAQDAQATNDSA